MSEDIDAAEYGTDGRRWKVNGRDVTSIVVTDVDANEGYVKGRGTGIQHERGPGGAPKRVDIPKPRPIPDENDKYTLPKDWRDHLGDKIGKAIPLDEALKNQ